MSERIIGAIEWKDDNGKKLRAELGLDGWKCADTSWQSVFDFHASPEGCLSQPAFQVELLERAARLVGGDVAERPDYGDLPEGALG